MVANRTKTIFRRFLREITRRNMINDKRCVVLFNLFLNSHELKLPQGTNQSLSSKTWSRPWWGRSNIRSMGSSPDFWWIPLQIKYFRKKTTVSIAPSTSERSFRWFQAYSMPLWQNQRYKIRLKPNPLDYFTVSIFLTWNDTISPYKLLIF